MRPPSLRAALPLSPVFSWSKPLIPQVRSSTYIPAASQAVKFTQGASQCCCQGRKSWRRATCAGLRVRGARPPSLLPPAEDRRPGDRRGKARLTSRSWFPPAHLGSQLSFFLSADHKPETVCVCVCFLRWDQVQHYFPGRQVEGNAPHLHPVPSLALIHAS